MFVQWEFTELGAVPILDFEVRPRDELSPARRALQKLYIDHLVRGNQPKLASIKVKGLDKIINDFRNEPQWSQQWKEDVANARTLPSAPGGLQTIVNG
jgi:hypothetical protein